MDGKIDKVREALIKLRAFAKSFDCDYQEECTPGDDDMCQSCKHVCIADGALADLAALSAHDEAIRRECAEKAVAWQVALCRRDDWHCECCTECSQLRYAILSAEPTPTMRDFDPEAIRAEARAEALKEFWEELHAEAEVHYDRRLELLGPIETADDAAFRKTLGDGWSAWVLAKKIIDNRHAAILSTEPAQDGSQLKCGLCGNIETPPYADGDACYCGGHFKPAQDDGKLRFRCRDCNSEFDESVMEYYCDDEDGEGDYIGECPVCGSRNLSEVKRRIEEAKE